MKYPKIEGFSGKNYLLIGEVKLNNATIYLATNVENIPKTMPWGSALEIPIHLILKADELKGEKNNDGENDGN